MNWSYVAGYFDGEGCVRCKAPPSRGGYKIIGLFWANTHIASLEAIHDFIGCGRVTVKPMRGLMRKPAGELRVSRVDDVIRVGEAMSPYLIVKRPAMEEMLAYARDNIKPMPMWGALTNAGPDAIRRLYHDEGLTQCQIAAKFGVSDGAVSTFFVRNGINGRRRGPKEGAFGVLAEYGHEKIQAMYDGGMTIAEIAKEVGVRYQTVYMHFYARGVRLTRRVRTARAARASMTGGDQELLS